MLEKVLVFWSGIFQFFSSFSTSILESLSGLFDNFKKWILTLPSDETVPQNGPAPQPSKVAKVNGQNISQSGPSTVSVASQSSFLGSSNGRIQIPIAPGDKAKSLATKYRDAIATSDMIPLNVKSALNVDLIINAAYKQVFGNAHLMESERFMDLESQMCSGQITVRDFVRKLAKTERYRSLFWDKYPTVTAIELNFKHLLGRAPESQAEIAQHIQILAEGGFNAEIDSYVDSEEYSQNFGDDCVPHLRGYQSQVGRNVVGFTRSFSLFGTACSSDKSRVRATKATIEKNLMQDNPSDIPSLRSIPDSIPATLLVARPPRVSKELKAMAKELLENRNGYQLYRNS